MNVELKKWDEAFILSRENKQLSEYVHLKYAEHLILEDRFKEAQKYIIEKLIELIYL